MRSTTLVAPFAALVLALYCVAGANAIQVFDDADEPQLLARSPLDSAELIQLHKRQAAAGGGGGSPTVYTGLQTISGYDPPPASVYPDPVVSQGTILSPNQIPGYGDQANTNQYQNGNLGSGAGSSGNIGSSAALSNHRTGVLLPLAGTAIAALFAGAVLL